MLQVHYDLLHKLAEKLGVHKSLPGDNLSVRRMKQEPDVYLASMLNLLLEGLKPYRRGGYHNSGYIWSILPFADYEPNMKKMRKMLDQNAGEYTPEHMPSSCGQ